jgi:hypothetical protein
MYHVFYEGDAGEVIKDLGMMEKLPEGEELRKLWEEPTLEGTNLVADKDDESWMVEEEEDGPFWAEL